MVKTHSKITFLGYVGRIHLSHDCFLTNKLSLGTTLEDMIFFHVSPSFFTLQTHSQQDNYFEALKFLKGYFGLKDDNVEL